MQGGFNHLPFFIMINNKILKLLTNFWNWIFLIFILVFLECWARFAYGSTFLLNPFVIQSVLLFTAAPLLIGVGQTFVIISGGIDLSVAFAMGLASVIFATIIKSLAPELGYIAVLIGFGATCLIMLIPGFINGTLIARLNVPPFIGTLGMYGVARGVGYLTADGMTVPVNNDFFILSRNRKNFRDTYSSFNSNIFCYPRSLYFIIYKIWSAYLCPWWESTSSN